MRPGSCIEARTSLRRVARFAAHCSVPAAGSSTGDDPAKLLAGLLDDYQALKRTWETQHQAIVFDLVNGGYPVDGHVCFVHCESETQVEVPLTALPMKKLSAFLHSKAKQKNKNKPGNKRPVEAGTSDTTGAGPASPPKKKGANFERTAEANNATSSNAPPSEAVAGPQPGPTASEVAAKAAEAAAQSASKAKKAATAAKKAAAATALPSVGTMIYLANGRNCWARGEVIPSERFGTCGTGEVYVQLLDKKSDGTPKAPMRYKLGGASTGRTNWRLATEAEKEEASRESASGSDDSAEGDVMDVTDTAPAGGGGGCHNVMIGAPPPPPAPTDDSSVGDKAVVASAAGTSADGAAAATGAEMGTTGTACGGGCATALIGPFASATLVGTAAGAEADAASVAGGAGGAAAGAQANANLNEQQINQMKLGELRAALTARGVDSTGTKQAMAARLKAACTPVVDLEAELGKMVGMESLKAQLRDFQKSCENNRLKREAGHAVISQDYHMTLMGNPGTGKTTIARLLHKLLQSAGVLSPVAPFVEFKASHAEGENLGEARKNVQRLIDDARGGVLFADEAHNLTKHKQNMYGQQAASQLMDCLHDGNSDASQRVIVIYAGYREPIQKFMNSDPGYTRRVLYHFQLPDYAPGELAQIFLLKASALGRRIGDGVTVDMVAKLINEATDSAYRSNENGSIAEKLLSYTEQAMDLRLDGNYSLLSFEAADVVQGAEWLKALART